MFTTEIGKNGEELSIYVKSGTHANVKVFKNMTLTNSGLKRSAIDIEPGGVLDLWIAPGATVTVDSGFGSIGASFKSGDIYACGGTGGYAGIHVPHHNSDDYYLVGYQTDGTPITEKYSIVGDAILNVNGQGKLICFGGNAGDGGYSELDDAGGGGGGGAGAGIGGNGGNGGRSGKLYSGKASSQIAKKLNETGEDGYSGEDCGIINIGGSVEVYAYGGAGGSGGLYDLNALSSGCGAGGYPAAGIGGRWSWWRRR